MYSPWGHKDLDMTEWLSQDSEDSVEVTGSASDWRNKSSIQIKVEEGRQQMVWEKIGESEAGG